MDPYDTDIAYGATQREVARGPHQAWSLAERIDQLVMRLLVLHKRYPTILQGGSGVLWQNRTVLYHGLILPIDTGLGAWMECDDPCKLPYLIGDFGIMVYGKGDTSSLVRPDLDDPKQTAEIMRRLRRTLVYLLWFGRWPRLARYLLNFSPVLSPPSPIRTRG